jgi:hypothetical protein
VKNWCIGLSLSDDITCQAEAVHVVVGFPTYTLS